MTFLNDEVRQMKLQIFSTKPCEVNGMTERSKMLYLVCQLRIFRTLLEVPTHLTFISSTHICNDFNFPLCSCVR